MSELLERSARFIDEGVDEGPASTNPMDGQLYELADDGSDSDNDPVSGTHATQWKPG